MTDDTEDLKAALRRKAPLTPIPGRDMLSTGSTLLNLACSGRPNVGIGKGHYLMIVGDSASAKTWLALQILAEAARNKNFNDYRLIHNNAENGTLMDLATYFGKVMAGRYEEAPTGRSKTLEDFYYDLEQVHREGRPYIYILDSHDALTAVAEDDRFDERMGATLKGKDPGAGDYGDGKAKLNSRNLRRAVAQLADLGSILVIICQSRDNIGSNAMFNPKTRAGGRALRFYAHLEFWTSAIGKLKATVRGNPVQIGMRCKVAVKKNRVAGNEWEVEFPFIWRHGIDDVGSMVDYLVHWKHWAKADKGGRINAHDMELTGTREQLVARVEETGRERELRNVVAGVWAEVIEAAQVVRKPRYE